MGMTINTNKIRVKVASYALLDVLRGLEKSGVEELSITKEDGDLILIVDTSCKIGQNSGGCYVENDVDGLPDIKSEVATTHSTKSERITLHG